MTTYALFRQYEPTMTRAQLDGVALASKAALETYIFHGAAAPARTDHGIRWVRSYWEQGGAWGMCVFEAPSLAVLTGFQELCGTPFVDAMAVEEAGEQEAEGGRVLATPLRFSPAAEGGLRSTLGPAGEVLLRSYANSERGMAVAVFPEDAGLPDGMRRIPVVEILPSEYH